VIRRFFALAAKELRQHAVAAALLVLLLMGGYGLTLLTWAANKRSTTVFNYQWFFLITFVPVAAAVLGNRLIVSEWNARTQLFVEALPLRREEMALVKLGVGLGVLYGVTLGTLGVSTGIARMTEPVDARFFGILSGRALGFATWLWSVAFTMGFLGRLRIPIYLCAILAVAGIASMTEVELKRFGPFALVDVDTFPSERLAMPWDSLLETALVSAGTLVLGFALVLLNEGSLAESLSRRMSQREKATIAVLFCLALIAMGGLEQKRTKKPYAFKDGAVLRAPEVEVQYVSDERKEDGAALLTELARTLGELRATLGWDALPPVRVTFRGDLDGRTFERATIERADGVLVRANFARRPGWDSRGLVAYVLRATLSHRTKGRAAFEPKRWLHDGFSRWWAERGATGGKAWPRALWATRARRIDAELIRRWTLYREQAGEVVAEGVAYSGLVVLERLRGEQAVLSLAKAVYGRRPFDDVREVLWERDHPMARVFTDATGMDWQGFLDAWNHALDEGRATEEGKRLLASIPEARVTLKVEAGAGDVRSVDYAFAFAQPPAAGTLCALVHAPLGPYDFELEPHDLFREEHTATDRTFKLVGRYGKGARAFLALEVESEALDASLRLHAERRDVP
jgi:hypothetical protein